MENRPRDLRNFINIVILLSVNIKDFRKFRYKNSKNVCNENNLYKYLIAVISYS